MPMVRSATKPKSIVADTYGNELRADWYNMGGDLWGIPGENYQPGEQALSPDDPALLSGYSGGYNLPDLWTDPTFAAGKRSYHFGNFTQPVGRPDPRFLPSPDRPGGAGSPDDPGYNPGGMVNFPFSPFAAALGQPGEITRTALQKANVTGPSRAQQLAAALVAAAKKRQMGKTINTNPYSAMSILKGILG